MNCSATNGDPTCHMVVALCWTYLYNVDNGLWSTGGGGGPEGGQYGGSGSGWNSWDPPICEEEPQGRTATYQDCGPGWTPPGINVPILYDPCAEAQDGANRATTLSQNSVYLTAKNDVHSAGASDNLEHVITFGKDGNNNIIVSPMSTGGSSSGTVPNLSGSFADIHNHPDNTAPSQGDFYGLVEINHNRAGYDTRFLVTSNGSVYALLVVDLAKAYEWITNNPKQINAGQPDFPTAIADDYADAKSYMIYSMNINPQTSDEMAMAYILEKYDTGVALLKQNASGDFKRLRTTKTVVNGNDNYAPNNCQ